MAELEEIIDVLRELDKQRIQSAQWRDEGLKILEKGSDHIPPLENAVVLQALLELSGELSEEGEKSLEDLVEKLEKLKLEDIVEDQLSVLLAAEVMQALVIAPGTAFSKSAILYYYWIIRELFSSDFPNWAIGGARAGPKDGMVTAFVTAECVQALLSFAYVQEKIADFIGQVDAIQNRVDELNEIKYLPEEWLDKEMHRILLTFKITHRRFASALVPQLSESSEASKGFDAVKAFLKKLASELKKEIKNATKAFQEAKDDIERYRTDEKEKRSQGTGKEKSKAERELEKSEVAHIIASRAVNQALENAENGYKLFNQKGDFKNWEKLQKEFREAAKEVRRVLHPATVFLSFVLNRELALASNGSKGDWSPAEMACAATAWGMATGEWDDERLHRAAHHLSEAISDRGRFPIAFLHITPEGSFSFPSGSKILRAFAELLQHTQAISVEPELVRKMLHFFEDTRVDVYLQNGEGKIIRHFGWCHDYAPQLRHQYHRDVTATAILALATINRMLDERINALVLDLFTVKRPEVLKKGPDLDGLFCPDYGLSPALLVPDSIRRESVAILLQKMRDHVVGPKLKEDEDRVYSLVLHGPPGTGKTTIVEALALSCESPLVEITPSDIVVKGQEAVERRARTVFEALSLLTRVVILFDEFDPVLARRDPKGATPHSVLSFLTPGVLPKLKTLHDQAKRRSVAYVLITNLIGSLDEAVIRTGRFDENVGIYPPDLLSRTGRFLSVIAPFVKNNRLQGIENRLRTIIEKTGGAGMESLARKGWFLHTKNPSKEGTATNYLLNGTEPEKWPEQEAKLKCVNGKGPNAEQEFRQWAWVQMWDDELKDSTVTLTRALEKYPADMPKLIRPPEDELQSKRLTIDFGSDPTLAFDTGGNLFYGYIVVFFGNGSGINGTEMAVARSADGGKMYPFVTYFSFEGGNNHFNDKPMIATDTNPKLDSPFHDNVYIAWDAAAGGSTGGGIRVATSTDHGKTFTITRADDPSGPGRSIGASPAVGPNGELYVAWNDYRANVIAFNRSFDGGKTWDQQTTVTPKTIPFDIFIPAESFRGTLVYPVLDVDRSNGLHRGRLYCSWIDRTPSGTTDIFLAYSDNQGSHWSKPVTVADQLRSLIDRFNHWMSVDPTTGDVNISFYDTRNDTTGFRYMTDTYFAQSTNGGVSWINPDVRVSTASSNEHDCNGIFPCNAINYGNQQGDYEGLVSYNGVSYPIWTDSRRQLDPLTGCPDLAMEEVFTAKINGDTLARNLELKKTDVPEMAEMRSKSTQRSRNFLANLWKASWPSTPALK